MRIAVVIKQIPTPAQLRMDGGRVVRDGVDLEVNAYCRRANAKAVELAGPDGEVIVFTMGPPAAETALREMIACGATRGVHLCDTQFAGSDTLATARVLAAAIRHEGAFDLILGGLNSLDADTGQVPAELAELLGLPFAPGIRDIALSGNTFAARLETDNGYVNIEGTLPAVFSTSERLCEPSKAPPEQCTAVNADRIRLLTAADLGLDVDEVGVAGSPTWVGPGRVVEESRQHAMATSVSDAVDKLVALGAFTPSTGRAETVTGRRNPASDAPQIMCFFTEGGIGAELLGEAAQLAAELSGSVTAVTSSPISPGLGALGADRVLVIPNASEPSEFADTLAAVAIAEQPWALLVEGTRSGRVVASIVAARHGWGLTGDAIALEVDARDRLVAWKPAFGGRLEAPIYSHSPVQMATIRPGILARREPRDAADPPPTMLESPRSGPLRTISTDIEVADSGELQRADIVVAVGRGIGPEGYGAVADLRAVLGGASLGSTRKVTDIGWLPRNTQIGVTGHSIAPQLLIAIGSSGRFNHTVGLRNAGAILAINNNPDAEIFDQVDIGIVGDWQDVVPALTQEIASRGLIERREVVPAS